MDVFRLSEWGPCRNLDLDPIGVFEKDGVVFFSACERMPFGIQQREAAALQFPVQFVHLMFRVDSEGEMVQPRPAAVVGSIQEAFGCLDEDDVSIVFPVAEALIPFLVFAEAQLFQQPRPKCLASGQITDIDFDMMDDTHIPTSFLLSQSLELGVQDRPDEDPKQQQIKTVRAENRPDIVVSYRNDCVQTQHHCCPDAALAVDADDGWSVS